jgi:Cu(I)/Ag(I) efflux system membrane protein CusA/SilA
VLQVQDKVLKTFPEVERVFGKAGRADTSTDPAPLSMMETTIILKPQDEWRRQAALVLGPGARVAQGAVVRPDLARPHHLGRTGREMDRPCAARRHQRLDDADQGAHRHADHGHAHAGGDQDLRRRPRRDRALGLETRGGRREVPGTRSVFAERAAGGYFVDFELNRDELARYGLSVATPCRKW